MDGQMRESLDRQYAATERFALRVKDLEEEIRTLREQVEYWRTRNGDTGLERSEARERAERAEARARELEAAGDSMAKLVSVFWPHRKQAPSVQRWYAARLSARTGLSDAASPEPAADRKRLAERLDRRATECRITADAIEAGNVSGSEAEVAAHREDADLMEEAAALLTKGEANGSD